MNALTLTEDEQDALQELMNIAYGDATAIVAEMLDAYATLSIPNIRIIETTTLLEEMKGLKGGGKLFFFISSI